MSRSLFALTVRGRHAESPAVQTYLDRYETSMADVAQPMSWDAAYLRVVSDPRFKLLGFTFHDIVLVKERMHLLGVQTLDEVLKPTP